MIIKNQIVKALPLYRTCVYRSVQNILSFKHHALTVESAASGAFDTPAVLFARAIPNALATGTGAISALAYLSQ
jgi:hypothetical protein